LNAVRARRPLRVPQVLSVAEVRALLAALGNRQLRIDYSQASKRPALCKMLCKSLTPPAHNVTRNSVY
jgi:hypothetical protein